MKSSGYAHRRAFALKCLAHEGRGRVVVTAVFKGRGGCLALPAVGETLPGAFSALGVKCLRWWQSEKDSDAKFGRED